MLFKAVGVIHLILTIIIASIEGFTPVENENDQAVDGDEKTFEPIEKRLKSFLDKSKK